MPPNTSPRCSPTPSRWLPREDDAALVPLTGAATAADTPTAVCLTAFGVVLGVGMVFGVLLLVGTIRATFDEVIDSAWGRADLIVMGEGSGGLPTRSTGSRASMAF